MEVAMEVRKKVYIHRNMSINDFPFRTYSWISILGLTLHNKDPEFFRLVEKVARVLNIKGHEIGVGEQKKFLYGLFEG